MKRWLFLWVFMLGTTVYASPVNDDFFHSIQVTSTNLDYAGDMEGASLESGEPTNGATNTIWVSWASPVTGYATLLKDAASQFQYYAVYTGPVVDHLEPVDLVPLYFNSYYRFLATKGTVYRFQFSGGASPIHFHLQSSDFEDVANDNFSEATAILGEQLTFQGSIGDATMELGEPAHMGAMVPQKSVWWKWQAPLWGIYRMDPASSLATNVTLAAYSGSSVEALTFIAKADHSNPLEFSVIGGQTYYIAAAVGTNVGGDVRVMASYAPADTSAHAIAGNLLLEPSWEGTGILGAKHWGMSGGIGGCVNESFGGADGTTWPALSGGAKVWQGFSTTPGHSYAVRFADLIGGKASGGAGDGQIGVMLNNTFLKSFTIPENESGFWHWAECTFLATNRSSLVTFTNMGRTIELDAFSAIDVSSPPVIITQPGSISCVAGATAAMIVGVQGTAPLRYQWYFNGAPLDGQTNKLLVLDEVAATQAGNYRVAITNAFGSITSAIAALSVESPLAATILSQPYGDTVSVGGYFCFSAAAAGTASLRFQWFLNNAVIAGATNNSLILTNIQLTDAGHYLLRVRNDSSTAWSLPAELVVVPGESGGGTLDFRNRLAPGDTNLDAPIFDLDGLTPLNGSRFVAQLYAGPTLDALRPAARPTPFQDGFAAGYFAPALVTLANVRPGGDVVVQVCAWDSSYGTSYEQARAAGGRFGKSNIIGLTAGGGNTPAQPLTGLQSFKLQAGLPYFEVGTITFVERQPRNVIVWALHGQANSVYLIEKSKRSEETVWRPFLVLTNATGTVTFTDTADSAAAVVWYRGRILD